MGEAVAAVFDAIAECKEADRRNVEREKQWAEERRLQAEAEERRRRHEARVKRLREEAAFCVSAAEEKIAAAGPIEQDSKSARWIKWARRQADRMDPLTPTTEEPDNDGLDTT